MIISYAVVTVQSKCRREKKNRDIAAYLGDYYRPTMKTFCIDNEPVLSRLDDGIFSTTLACLCLYLRVAVIESFTTDDLWLRGENSMKITGILCHIDIRLNLLRIY